MFENLSKTEALNREYRERRQHDANRLKLAEIAAEAPQPERPNRIKQLWATLTERKLHSHSQREQQPAPQRTTEAIELNQQPSPTTS